MTLKEGICTGNPSVRLSAISETFDQTSQIGKQWKGVSFAQDLGSHAQSQGHNQVVKGHPSVLKVFQGIRYAL